MANDNSEAGYSREDWEKHYQSEDLGWDLGKVSPPFLSLWQEQNLVPCKTIIPGCGRGHEAVFLAENGFRVTAVDYCNGAVNALRKSIADKGLECDILHQDFFDLDSSHDSSYELMLEQTFFCAISPSQRKLYVETAHRILKFGGLLLGLFYETNAEGGPPFNTTRSDILHHFCDRFMVQSLKKTSLSDEQRKNKEWLGFLKKK